MKTWAILLAGGKGLRMGGETPKQFLEIAGLPVALHSYRLLQALDLPIIVVCEPEYQSFFDGDVLFAEPGKERQDSVYNGSRLLPAEAEYVLVHDAARPCLRKERVEKLLEEAYLHGAAVLGVPAKNTVKEVARGFVLRTLDRSTLWEVSTPQVLKKAWLEEGFEKVRANGLLVTDDVSLAELLGHPVKMVLDHPSNGKLTHPEDLPQMMEALAHATL
jgi:2-C-methyl-D-erythritol 4-phosphate cytidylyltransferase